jgi:16S rRNA (uracil1498-N3)-methyltransferase
MRLRTVGPNGRKDRTGSGLSRSYLEAPLAVGGFATLSENATAHLVRVLRLGLGDACIVFNGDGADYEARLVGLGKRGAEVEVMARHLRRSEPALRITLAQALARGEKMDLVLQKATELGVSRIVPISTERSEVKLDAERSEKRLVHWRGVIAAACEQCGRARLPELAPPQALRDWLADTGEAGWYLEPEAEHALPELGLGADASVTLVIGPEGGLGERDLGALRTAGFRGLRLGPRVLRTETAGLAAIAALQALYGDFR